MLLRTVLFGRTAVVEEAVMEERDVEMRFRRMVKDRLRP